AFSVIKETIKFTMRATIIIAKLNPKISVVEKLDDCNALISSKNCFSVSMVPYQKLRLLSI
ncbi:hypothetical protein, partial [Escherichia coli]|uniref:hypothetical protein n=1 Tax=Escherichia coli TaxID=562 RepID=UPI0022641026